MKIAETRTRVAPMLCALLCAAVVGAKGLPVVIGQGSACTTILSAAEMQLHCALKNAQPGGEMTGFMRLGEQDIFSPITVTRGTAYPPMTAGHGIEVDKEKLRRLAQRFRTQSI